MDKISCVFVQGNRQVSPFIYSLNQVVFSDQSILSITTNFREGDNVKEIGPIPFFVNEIQFLNRYKDELDQLDPHVQTNSEAIKDILDINKPIQIFIMKYQDVEDKLKINRLDLKYPEYAIYYKYLFLLKYFPYSLGPDFIISSQFQLKQNEIQQIL